MLENGPAGIKLVVLIEFYYNRYCTQVNIVKQVCKEADEVEIIKAFSRYEKDFLIPPEDALCAIIRKFNGPAGI